MSQEKLEKSIEKLKALQEECLKIGCDCLRAKNNELHPTDMVILGIIKRVQSTSSGIILMAKESNMGCLRALLRLQLDTLLRFSAFTLVENPQSLARHIIAGKRLKDFQCRKGQKLLDRYLVDNLKSTYPWVETVYQKTSDYIHFSGSQIYDSVATIDDNTNEMHFCISDKDDKYSYWSWIEVIDCSSHCLEIIKGYLLTYIEQKNIQ